MTEGRECGKRSFPAAHALIVRRICGFEGVYHLMAQWRSWLSRRPVTAEVTGSSPVWVVFGILAQLGEHLPYKQGVTGSSPVGPITCIFG